jgi:hypothetical protein
MKLILPLLLCLGIATLVCAQINLVPNGSFEEYTQCPDNTSQVDSCVGWYSVYYSPDYYAECAPYPVAVPDNFCGYQHAFDGSAYIGLLTYVWYFEDGREFIGTQLLDTLIPGNTYHVSMRVSRGNWTTQAYNCAASNKLGMLFSTQQYTLNEPPPVSNFAHVYEDLILTDTLNWILLSWNFIADSAYTWVYIGNFFSDDQTDTAVINAPLGQFGDAYYFIDSVNINCLDKECFTSVHDPSSETAFTYQSTTYACFSEEAGTVTVYNLNGKIILRSQIDKFMYLPDMPAGLYILTFQNKKLFKTIKIIL